MLRRNKVLANINKEKINLADQPLPNAKGFLFGEDFPSVASKQAELSRGLAKNLSNVQKPKQAFQKSGTNKVRQRPKTTGTSSKYQTNRPKNYRSFRPQQGPLKPRLNNYLERWKEITSDPEIIHVVLGYQIPFHSVPVQLHVPVTKCSDLTVPFVNAEVSKLLSVGAIKAVPFSKENFFSRLFLVPKKEGTYRPVIDLSRLNKFVENFHFQMENISCLKTLLRRGDFMTCIDLKDAYLSIHVHRSSQKCFQWRNRCYAFQGLPFALNTGYLQS